MNTRKKISILLLFITVIAFAAVIVLYFKLHQQGTEIKVGSKVPEFILPDQDGKEFDIKNIIGQKNLVIYFYPKDDSPGCTKEACSFRDQYEEFVKADAIVIGISAQSVDSHKKFVDKYNLPYTLLSDADNEVRKQFGVKTNENGSIAGRVTFVIDKNGTVIYTFSSQFQPLKHVEEALRILKEKMH